MGTKEAHGGSKYICQILWHVWYVRGLLWLASCMALMDPLGDVVGSLMEGDTFGERALILGGKRNATIMAHKGVSLIAIAKVCIPQSASVTLQLIALLSRHRRTSFAC